MTSRFRNLEFNDERTGRGGQPAPVVRDEAYYLDEARTAYEAGRFEAGLRNYARVLEFNPRSSVAWGGQVRMLIELGESREARLWADKGLEACPNEAELLAAKSVALARCGDLAAALAFSDAAIEVQGSIAYVWLARADVLLTRKERAAEPCFDKALALASFHWFTLWLAARVHVFHHQFARASSLVQRALESAADRAVLWLELGECQMALGLTGAARSALAQAKELDPESVTAERVVAADERGVGTWVRGLWRRWRGD